MSLVVCYYNSYLLLLSSQLKATIKVIIKQRVLEGTILAYLVIISVVSLGWLTIL